MLNRLYNKSASSNTAFVTTRNMAMPHRNLADRMRQLSQPVIQPMSLARLFSDERAVVPSTRTPENLGHIGNIAIEQNTDCSQSNPDKTELKTSTEKKRQEYRLQQSAYVSKIRASLTPRPLTEEFKEFDSTKDNPPNSKSARFGLKPEPNVYQYRLVSWGEAGCGIPLVNNPYSVRPQNAPAVDAGFKRKKFTTEQRESVRNAPYRQAVQNILNAGLHNSHGLASRFLGPETSTNIAPATFTNNKNKNWGQGEMQSHLEHALFRIEGKTNRNGVSIFLRCTDYLGKFGELQSRKIKIFLSEAVTDGETLAKKGNVKETTLGTFYFPGMISEAEDGDFIKAFKNEVTQLEKAVELILTDTADHKESFPLEIRYKYGVCAEDLKTLSYQKLVHGKQFRTNDGLRPVLQHRQIPPNIRGKLEKLRSTALIPSNQPDEKQKKVFHQIEKIRENPQVLKAGEELWEMNEIETALGHIRRPDLEDHIKSQVDSGELDWEQSTTNRSKGLSRFSSESSLNSLSTIDSEKEDREAKEFEIEFDLTHQEAESNKARNSDSSFIASSHSSRTTDSTLDDSTRKPPQKPSWLRDSPEKKRKPEFH